MSELDSHPSHYYLILVVAKLKTQLSIRTPKLLRSLLWRKGHAPQPLGLNARWDGTGNRDRETSNGTQLREATVGDPEFPRCSALSREQNCI